MGPWSTNAFPNPTVGSGYSGWTLYAPHSKCVLINGTYYLTACSDIAVTNCLVNEFTSTDATNFTYRGVALSPGTYDKSIENMYIWNEGGNKWWAIYESGYQFSSPSSIYSFALFLASSTDGLTWTKQNGGQPILSIAPPYGFAGHANVWKDPATSLVHCWFHGTPTNNANLTGIWHSWSVDRTNWISDAGNPVIAAGTEIQPGSVQIADPDIRQYNGQTYIFYDTTAAGGIGAADINAAVFPGTLGMLVSSNLGTAGNTASNVLAMNSLTAAKLAGDEATLSGTITAAQAGTIATNTVNNMAPGLSVSYAATAGSAGTAGSATTAATVTGGQSNTILTALQPAATNGWVVSSHAGFLSGNGVSGTDPVGTIAANGLVTTVGSSTPWTGLGYVTQTVTNGLLAANGNGSALTGITASQVGAISNTAAGLIAAGGLTNIVIGGSTGTVVNGIASASIAGVLTNGNMSIGYSNNMIYFNIPIVSCTGIVFNIGGSNVLMKQVNP